MTIKAGQKLIIKWKAGDNSRPVDMLTRSQGTAEAPSEDFERTEELTDITTHFGAKVAG